MQRAFISKQKQWLKNIKKSQYTNTNPKYDRINQNQEIYQHDMYQNNKILNGNKPSNNQIDQSLAKTVKHTNYSNKKINSSYHTQNAIISRHKPQNFNNHNNQIIQKDYINENMLKGNNFFEGQNKKIIMSIDQIHQEQKSVGNSMIIHKISSSNSRKKLKNSSSKDSKQSDSIKRQSIKSNKREQKYSKYLQNQLINIHIDLRNDILNNQINSNKNPADFISQYKGHNNLFQKSVQRPGLQTQKPKSTNLNDLDRYQSITSRPSHKQYKQFGIQSDQNQYSPITSRNNNDNSGQNLIDKLKTRSKSNLSKYSQLKSKKQETININQKQYQNIQKDQKIVRNNTCSLMEQKLVFNSQPFKTKRQIISNFSVNKHPIQQTPKKLLKQQFNPISKSISQKKVHLLGYSTKINSNQRQNNISYNQKYPINSNQRRFSSNLVQNSLITLTQPHHVANLQKSIRKSDFFYEKNYEKSKLKEYHQLNANIKGQLQNNINHKSPILNNNLFLHQNEQQKNEFKKMINKSQKYQQNNLSKQKEEQQVKKRIQQQKLKQIQFQQKKAKQRLKQVEKLKKQLIQQQTHRNKIINQEKVHNRSISQQNTKNLIQNQDKNKIAFQTNYYDVRYSNSNFLRTTATNDKNALTQMIQEKIKKRPIKLTIQRKN